MGSPHGGILRCRAHEEAFQLLAVVVVFPPRFLAFVQRRVAGGDGDAGKIRSTEAPFRQQRLQVPPLGVHWRWKEHASF